MCETYRNYIAGRWVEASSGQVLDDINPADTTEILGRFPASAAEDAAPAVEAAEAALPDWRTWPVPKRAKIVARAAQILEDQKNELAAILTREQGKTLAEAKKEITGAVSDLHYAAAEGQRALGVALPSTQPGHFCFTTRMPVGVVVAITPWNYPVAISAWKLGPALVAGNTLVFKPASYTPWTGLKLTEAFVEAGLPPGVLNFVTGRGSTVGTALVSDPRVRGITFTGSTAVGREIAALAGQNMAKVQLELGGKNPFIVCEDADLDLAVSHLKSAAFGVTGQKCTATSRVIVFRSVKDAFVEKLLAMVGSIRVGNGLDPEVDTGPVTEETQLRAILGFIERAKEQGARVLCGGSRMTEPPYDRGYFVEPTVFDDVTPDMEVAQEEVFGPVLAILTVDRFEEAVAVANEVKYGLSSSIYTYDLDRVFRFVEATDVGITHVNEPTNYTESSCPLGGIKQSGIGPREKGISALLFFTEEKAVYVNYARRGEGRGMRDEG